MNRTSEQWCRITGIEILDPDGWDRSTQERFDADWNRRISFNEFWEKMTRSTVSQLRGDRDAIWNNIATRLMRGEAL